MNQLLNIVWICLSFMHNTSDSVCRDVAEFASATFIEASGYLPPHDTNERELRDARLQVKCLLSRKLGFPNGGNALCDPVHDSPFEVLLIASFLLTEGEVAFGEGRYPQFIVGIESLKIESEAVLSHNFR